VIWIQAISKPILDIHPPWSQRRNSDQQVALHLLESGSAWLDHLSSYSRSLRPSIPLLSSLSTMGSGDLPEVTQLSSRVRVMKSNTTPTMSNTPAGNRNT
jgi:hypothetical protein